MFTANSFDKIKTRQDIIQFIPQIEKHDLLKSDDFLMKQVGQLKDLLERLNSDDEILEMIIQIEKGIGNLLGRMNIGGDKKIRLCISQFLLILKFFQKAKGLYQQEVACVIQGKSPKVFPLEAERKHRVNEIVKNFENIQETTSKSIFGEESPAAVVENNNLFHKFNDQKQKSKNFENIQETTSKSIFGEELSAVVVENNDLSKFYIQNQNSFIDLNRFQKKKDLRLKIKKYIKSIFTKVINYENLPLEVFEDLDKQVTLFVNSLSDQFDIDRKKYFIDSFNNDLLEKFKNVCLELYNSNEKRKKIANKSVY